jgi:CelD/BcsL family acetyltransferase involved in cellulose biosynthesis
VIRIQEIRDWQAIERHAQAWNDLARRSDTATIFQSFEWHAAWWKVFRDDYELRMLLAWNDSRLAGIAPWVLSRKTGELQFLGSGDYSSDYCDFLIHPAHPDAVEPLAAWIFESARAWRKLDFRNFPSHSGHRLRFERCLRKQSPYVFSEIETPAPTRILGNASADREAVNKASLKRHFNWFKKNGKLEFAHLESEQEILPLLDLFFRQHIERRAMTGTPSQFLNPKQRQFYRELVRLLAPARWLKFGVVRFNGSPIAFHFGFEYKSRFVWYKPAFSAEHAKQSPGEVLLKFLLEYAVGRQLEEFDFTVGDEPFKYRFANHIRTNHRVQVFSLPIGYWLRHAKKLAKQILRRPASPALS